MAEHSGVSRTRLGLLGVRPSVLCCGGECLADGGVEVVVAERSEGGMRRIALE
jgi:hypothetical protein